MEEAFPESLDQSKTADAPRRDPDLIDEHKDLNGVRMSENDQADRSQTRDTISQFGLLVPSSLRAARQSFELAFVQDSSLVDLVNLSREMADLELEIRRSRKRAKKTATKT